MVTEKQQEALGTSTAAKKYYYSVMKGPKKEHPYVYFLGLRISDTGQLLVKIEEGLSYSAFEKLQHNIDLPNKRLAELAQISTRTLNRRKSSGRFNPDESDRLVRLSRIYGKAIELFEGDEIAARAWLGKKQQGLGGTVPFDLVKSEVGAREVENLIGRLEHGVFS